MLLIGIGVLIGDKVRLPAFRSSLSKSPKFKSSVTPKNLRSGIFVCIISEGRYLLMFLCLSRDLKSVFLPLSLLLVCTLFVFFYDRD